MGEKNAYEQNAESSTLGNDLYYWPKKKYHQILTKSEKNPKIPPDLIKCEAARCKIKRFGYRTRAEVRSYCHLIVSLD